MAAQPAGYSGTPLPKKLGIKEGHRVAVLSPPRAPELILGPLPEAVVLETDPPIPSSVRAQGPGSFDVILAFVRNRAELEDRFPLAKRLLSWDGGLWVSWPKGSSPLASDVREDHVRRQALAAGLVDNKVCAVDQDWSGLRLVYRLEDRPGQRRRR